MKMQKKSRFWCLTVALFALVLALFAFGSNQADAASNTLTYGSPADPQGLSSIDTNDSVSEHVADQVFETLFRLNPKTMKPEPLLATSYENPDPNTWIIHLRKGVKFQDGTPFNADAVKYTFDTIKDPKRAAPRASLLAPISSVIVKDENTVELKTAKPYGPMLYALSHYNAAIVSPTADKKGNLNHDPVGTGPYKFVSWQAGNQVKLTRNDSYWGKKPTFKNVVYKTVPEENTLISMLQTGKIDFIDTFPSNYLSRLKSLNNVKVSLGKGTSEYYLTYNMSKKPFNNLKFRQAVAYAINSKAYVKQLNGMGVYNQSYIGPEVFGYNAANKNGVYQYNPKLAKKMVKANGFNKQTYTILVPGQEVYTDMAEIVQQQLQDAGFKVKLEKMEWATFLTTSMKGNFQMTFLAWANTTGDGSELFYPNLDSKNIGVSNRTRYDNKAFDAVVEKSRETINRQQRLKYLNEANKLAMKDAPWVIMNHGVTSLAYNKNIKGLQMDPTGAWYLNNVK